MLTCRELAELVTDYAEGHLPPAERLRFRLHLLGCPDCRAYVRQVALAARAAGALPPPELPQPLEAELLRRFEGWKGRRG